MGSVRTRLLAGLVLLLTACGAAPGVASSDPRLDWLSRVYFGSRDTVKLPDWTRSDVNAIRVWRVAGSTAPPVYVDTNVLSHYFDFNVHSGITGFWKPEEYAAGDPGEILDRLQKDVSDLRIISVPVEKFLKVNVLVDGDTRKLAAIATKKRMDVRFESDRCLVVRLIGDRPDHEITNVLISSPDGQWDMNRLEVERCYLAGLLSAYRMDVDGVMRAPDYYFPHEAGKVPCLFASSRPGADTRMQNFVPIPCLSRARSAWAFTVLRRAAERGRLPAGATKRADFEAALRTTADELGGSVRAAVEDRETSKLALARTDRGQMSPVVLQESKMP